MLAYFNFIRSEIMHYLYEDKSYYYYCATNNTISNSTHLKFSVLRRFLSLIKKNDLFLHTFISNQYVLSFSSMLYNFYFSLLFPFKKRLKFHGLAFSADYDKLQNTIALNVGYSSTPVFLVPEVIEVVIFNSARRKFLFESRFLNIMSNFVTRLRDVRPINVYFNPAKRGGRRGIRIYLSSVKRKKFNKDIK